jgi:hypothetical protein
MDGEANLQSLSCNMVSNVDIIIDVIIINKNIIKYSVLSSTSGVAQLGKTRELQY